MEYLKKIQLAMKIMRIVSCVVMWVCLVSFGLVVLCSVAVLIFPKMASLVFETGSSTLSFGAIICSMLSGAVACAGATVSAYFWYLYFVQEEKDGTPFVESTAKMLLKAGIVSVIVGLAVAVICGILGEIGTVYGLSFAFFTSGSSLDIAGFVFALVASWVFSYGAALEKKEKNN